MEKLEIDVRRTTLEAASRLEKSLALLADQREVQEFLNILFSPTEKERLAKRLEILKKLRQEIPYKEIKKDLKVSDNTIAEMSNALKEAPPQALRTVDRMLGEDLKEGETNLRFTTAKITS